MANDPIKTRTKTALYVLQTLMIVYLILQQDKDGDD